MTETVVITHKASSYFHNQCAKYAVAQSLSCGYRTIVLSDSQDIAIGGAEFYNFSDYSKSADEFAKIYKHISSNDYDYELFCFQRWFLISELLREIRVPVWVIDSDVLVYPGLGDLKHFAYGKMWNIPHTNFFRGVEDLSLYTDFCMATFANESEIDRISKAYTPSPHMSDMLLFFELGFQNSRIIPHVHILGQHFGLDYSVRHTNGFRHENDHKIVEMRAGIPFCSRDIGGEVRFYTFHFQGMSKPLMQAMHTVTSPEILCFLEDLTYYFLYNANNVELGKVRAVYDKFLSRI